MQLIATGLSQFAVTKKLAPRLHSSTSHQDSLYISKCQHQLNYSPYDIKTLPTTQSQQNFTAASSTVVFIKSKITFDIC